MIFEEIDQTYVISIPDSDRRDIIGLKLGIAYIDFEFLDAVHYKDGALGLKVTIANLFSNMILNDESHILVFEDDMKFCCDNPLEEIEKVIADLPNDYDLCKFGANLLAPVTKITDNLNKISISYALHAVLYSRSGIEKILKHIHEPDPIDVIIAKRIEPQGNCYVSSKMIATQRPGKSDIFKYDPKIHNLYSIKEIYNHETEVVNWHNLMVSQWEKNTKHLK